MGALLNPSDAILLLVASPAAAPLVCGLSLVPEIDFMVRAAGACAVPILEIQFQSLRTQVEQSPSRATPPALHTIYSLDVQATDWSATALGIDIAKANRTSLIVIGYWLEEAVTFVVLRALSHSYKVYVVLDGTPAKNRVSNDAARQRLVFAGAVPTTTHQVLCEWTATTADPVCRQALLALRAV